MITVETHKSLQKMSKRPTNDLKFRIDLWVSTVSLLFIIRLYRKINHKLGYNDEEVDKYYEHVTEKQPLGGVIEPEQIATAAAMLASTDLPSLTGQLLIIDGGRSQHPV